jgi:hypothetical protein
MGLAVCALLATFSGAVSARAQPADSIGSSALDPAIPANPSDLDRALLRAESLFRLGDAALSEGREADAQDAFDAALDVFVAMKGPAATDARFLAAYRGMVDRIMAAEVASSAARQTPAAAPSSRAVPAAPSSAAAPQPRDSEG